MAQVAIQMKSMTPDRSPYKRYSTTYEPGLVFVNIDIPDSEIVQQQAKTTDDKEVTISLLTPKGAVALITALTEIGEEVDNYFQSKYNQGETK